MQIEDRALKDIKPYEKNPRKNAAAVGPVAESIREFGFKVPIVIDKDGIIVAGHTRYKAAKKLGLKSAPCVIADDLTEEQVKAFRLADNKVAEQAEWDTELLGSELSDIFSLDMSAFGFVSEDMTEDKADEPEDEEEGYYGDERQRTIDFYNMALQDEVDFTGDFWQMPIIRKEQFTPTDLIGFNYAKTSTNKETGIHCFIDDYQFERLWNSPDEYIDMLKEYQCFLSPDFSLYTDMMMATKIYNIYRSRLIGAYYQAQGVKVIPTVSWAEPATYEFCFKGIEQGGTVAVSTIGVKKDKTALAIWTDGMNEMIRQLSPAQILVYGGELDFDYGGIDVVYYTNHVTDEWR